MYDIFVIREYRILPKEEDNIVEFNQTNGRHDDNRTHDHFGKIIEHGSESHHRNEHHQTHHTTNQLRTGTY